MKYEPLTTVYLLLLLCLAQFIGLFITQRYYYVTLPYTLEPPEVSDGFSVTYLIGGVILMSIIFYLFTRLRYEKLLRLWFSTAIVISLAVSFSVFIGDLMGFILALVLTVLRVYTRDLYVHNLTELFIYGGIVSIFAPIFSPLTAIIVLVIIAVYDYLSVFVTKHMIYLAKHQESVNVFTGLIVRNRGETAMLGGGDIAFSLLFASVLGSAYGVTYAYLAVYMTLIAITALTILGRRGKFYPAMPFITAACLISYALVLI